MRGGRQFDDLVGDRRHLLVVAADQTVDVQCEMSLHLASIAQTKNNSSQSLQSFPAIAPEVVPAAMLASRVKGTLYGIIRRKYR